MDDNNSSNHGSPPPEPPERPVASYLTGHTSNDFVAQGWTTETILYNHLDENVATATDYKYAASMAAVIMAQDRPADRAAGSDAISDAIVELSLAERDDFIVIPPIPKVGDPSSRVLPHTNLIVCKNTTLRDRVFNGPSKPIFHTQPRNGNTNGFSFYLLPVYIDNSWYVATYTGLSERVTRDEFLTGLYNKLVDDPTILALLRDNYDRIPDVPDVQTGLRALLHWAETRRCQVWLPPAPGRDSRSQRLHGIALYVPPPSLNDGPCKVWKEYLSSATFSFIVGLRGRASPFRPFRGGRPRTIECTECHGLDHYSDDCPIVNSTEYKAVHPVDAAAGTIRIPTTIGSINEADDDGFRPVHRNTRSRNGRGLRPGYARRGRPRD